MGSAIFLIFLCGAAGEILSGILADRLRRYFSRNLSFKLLFGGSGAFSLGALVALPFAGTATTVVVLLCAGVFFNRFSGLYSTFPGTIAKPDRVDLVGGVVIFAGTSAGIVVPIVTNIRLDLTGGYIAVLVFLSGAVSVYLINSLAIHFAGSRKEAEGRA